MSKFVLTESSVCTIKVEKSVNINEDLLFYSLNGLFILVTRIKKIDEKYENFNH